jgi:hypothetical protein
VTSTAGTGTGASGILGSIKNLLGTAAGNDVAQQLFVWGIFYGLVTSVFSPLTTAREQEAWEAAVEVDLHRALSPAALAVLVVRGWMTQGAAEAEAMKAGIAQNDFANMVNAARNPIAPQEAAVAWRRHIIPETAPPGVPSFLTAITEGDLGDQWAGVIADLATQIPSPADILQAVLQGQVPAGVDPRTLYERCGGMATDNADGFDWFQLMFDTRGSAPTPMEALDMVKRGAIVWGDGSPGHPLDQGPQSTSYHQAFLEGPWRDKWEPAFKALAEYIPPPRSVVAMLHNGSITAAQATIWFEEAGLAPATAQAYIADATRTKTAKTKQLTESQVLGLLNDHLIDQATAVQYLEQLGYPGNEATTLAATGAAARVISDLNSNISRVRTYYTAHKINRSTAVSELGQLGLPPDRVTALVAGWDVVRSSNVRVLTPAQIENAWEYGIMTEAEALAELQVLGYTPLDAWTLLSIKAKTPLPNKPAGMSALTP